MPIEKRDATVYCTTDHPQHFDPAVGYHVDSSRIVIPDKSSYHNHYAWEWTGNGHNKHEIIIEKRPGDLKVVGVVLKVYVEKRTSGMGTRHWLGMNLVVEIDSPAPVGDPGSPNLLTEIVESVEHAFGEIVGQP